MMFVVVYSQESPRTSVYTEIHVVSSVGACSALLGEQFDSYMQVTGPVCTANEFVLQSDTLHRRPKLPRKRGGLVTSSFNFPLPFALRGYKRRVFWAEGQFFFVTVSSVSVSLCM